VAPIATSHHEVLDARNSPATPASKNDAKAAFRTLDEDTSFDAVKRKGPTRISSVPRMPSE